MKIGLRYIHLKTAMEGQPDECYESLQMGLKYKLLKASASDNLAGSLSYLNSKEKELLVYLI